MALETEEVQERIEVIWGAQHTSGVWIEAADHVRQCSRASWPHLADESVVTRRDPVAMESQQLIGRCLIVSFPR